MKFKGESWFLVRRAAGGKQWHPARDDATGTESYNVRTHYRPEPTATDNTFSLKYSAMNWDKIMFAWGDLKSYVVFPR